MGYNRKYQQERLADKERKARSDVKLDDLDSDFSLESDYRNDSDNFDGMPQGDIYGDDAYVDSGLNDDFNLDAGMYGGDSSSTMEKHNDLLKQLTNFSPFIKQKYIGWLGLVWNEEKGKYIKDENAVPVMNSKCAAWCVDYLRTYTRDNNIITDVSSQEYANIVHDIIDVLWLNIGTRAEEFGIRTNGDILRICVEMQHAAELVLMGAGDGKYNQLLSTVTHRSENVSYQPQGNMGYGFSGMPQQEKKLGLMGKIKKAIVG